MKNDGLGAQRGIDVDSASLLRLRASPDIELRDPAALIKEIRIHSTLLERPPGASDSFSMPLGKLQHVKVSHQSAADSGGIVPTHPYHGSHAVAR
jgi:hypothetical protein